MVKDHKTLVLQGEVVLVAELLFISKEMKRRHILFMKHEAVLHVDVNLAKKTDARLKLVDLGLCFYIIRLKNIVLC